MKEVFQLIIKAVNSFIEDNGFQYSAAVSFYTLFSLAPIVMIAVYTAGIFVGNESVMQELTSFLNESFGKESSQAVLLLVETIQTDTRNTFYLILSIVFLLVSATTVFVQFKDSFNRIFNVVVKPEVGFMKLLLDRLMAFGMIVLLGVAMITSLVLDSLFVGLFDLLSRYFESASLVMAAVGSNMLTILMIFAAVVVMFYILPDVKIRWRPLLLGSFITTLLLVTGKFGVGTIIGNSSLNQLSGASSSVIILMLWVYYSSIIIFFGIELVKVFAEFGEDGIRAGKYTRKIHQAPITKSDERNS